MSLVWLLVMITAFVAVVALYHRPVEEAVQAIFEPLGIEFVQCKSGTEWSDSHIPQAIKAGKFDTIIIATPPQFHMETLQNIARVVARARKKITIYVEKPIDVSVSRVLAALVEEAMGFLQPIQNASDTLKANEAYSRYDPGNTAVEMQDILNKVLDDLPEDS